MKIHATREFSALCYCAARGIFAEEVECCGFFWRKIRRDCFGDRHLLWNFGEQLDVAVPLEAGAGGNQAAHDDVFLEAAQVIHLAGDGGFGEDARGLLEAGGGDEGIRRERRLGDAEQQRAPGSGTAALASMTRSFSSRKRNLSTCSLEKERACRRRLRLSPSASSGGRWFRCACR